MLRAQPCFNLRAQRPSQIDHLARLLAGDGPGALVLADVALLPERVKQDDGLLIQSNGVSERIDDAIMVRLARGPIAGCGERGVANWSAALYAILSCQSGLRRAA